MKRNLALAALAALCFSAVAWFFWNRGASPPATSAALPAPGLAQEGESQTGLVLLDVPGESGADSSRIAAVEPRLRKPRFLDEDETTDTENELEFLVVEQETGEPVSGARIYLFDRGPFENEELMDFVERHGVGLELLARFGEPYSSDEQGRASLRNVSRDETIIAGKENLWGYFVYEDEAAPVLLELLRLPEIRVQALGPLALGARPLIDFPVALTQKEDSLRDGFVSARTRQPDGIASLYYPEPSPREGERVWVQPLAYLARPRSLELVSDALPSEPVKLHLPPMGGVTIQILRPNGTPFAGDARVEISRWVEGREPQDFGRAAEKAQSTGRVEFQHVETGMTLRAKVVVAEGAQESFATAPGPTRSGEQVVLHVTLEHDYPILAGRLVDEGGEALGAASLLVKWRAAPAPGSAVKTAGGIEPGSDGGATVREALSVTNRHGYFALTLDSPATSEGSECNLGLLFLATRASGPDSVEEENLGALVSHPLHGGANQLRDVVLAPAPVAVSGMVVDLQGAPVGEAIVRWSEDQAANAIVLGEIAPGRADGEGYFELRGWLDSGSLHVLASHPNYEQSEPEPVSMGTGNLRLVLHRRSQER